MERIGVPCGKPPRISTAELAKKLDRGTSAIGVTMAVYHQAAKKDRVREIAKDILIRELLHEFPEGWTARGDIHPLVKLGGWDSDVADYAHSARFGQYAERIVRSLAIDDPPQEGWRPQYPSDPLIDELFEHYWPIGD